MKITKIRTKRKQPKVDIMSTEPGWYEANYVDVLASSPLSALYTNGAAWSRTGKQWSVGIAKGEDGTCDLHVTFTQEDRLWLEKLVADMQRLELQD